MSSQPPPPPKRGRSSEVLLTFCNIVLDYEKYEVGVGDLFTTRDTSSPWGAQEARGAATEHWERGTEGGGRDQPPPPRASQHSDTDTVQMTMTRDDGLSLASARNPSEAAMIECSSCLSWFTWAASMWGVRNPGDLYCPACKEKRSGSEARPRRVSSGSARRKSGEASSATSPSSSPQLLVPQRVKILAQKESYEEATRFRKYYCK